MNSTTLGVLSLMALVASSTAQTSFGTQQLLTTSADGARSVYAADLDGDGDEDVLSASQLDSTIGWYENLGGGVFGPKQVITVAALGARSVYAADLDGDGDVDVLSAFYLDKVAWYENLGGGVFGAQQILTSAASGVHSVFAADLDGDGDRDVLSASVQDDKIAWYPNQGGGAFGAQQVITTAADGAWWVYATDLDGDGDVDVLSVSNHDAKVAWYENQGGGVFGAQQVIASTGNAPDAVRSVYATDLDGDGDADVVSASTLDTVVWHENQGGGVFGGSQVITTAVFNVRSVYATDLDGDGDADVLSASIYDDKVAWYENQLSLPAIISTSVVYGVGCGSPAMAFTPTSTAILNTAMTGAISDTPTALCVVAMGWSNSTMIGGGSLPLDLSAVGMTGCQLWQSNQVFGLSTQPSAQPSTVTWSLPLPNDTALLSAHVYTQAFSLAPGANPLQVVASNGIDWLIGNQ